MIESVKLYLISAQFLSVLRMKETIWNNRFPMLDDTYHWNNNFATSHRSTAFTTERPGLHTNTLFLRETPSLTHISR